MAKSPLKTKAEEKYAELQRKDVTILNDIDKANRVRSEKTAKLKKLRLEKEATDAAEALAAPPKTSKSRAKTAKAKTSVPA